MRAGLLRHRVVIQKPIVAQSASGHPETSYPPQATVWASIDPISGRERFTAQSVAADVTHRITMRANAYPTLDETHRISFANPVSGATSIYGIASVRRVQERDIMFEVLAVEQKSEPA